jgi:hypothetical protein
MLQKLLIFGSPPQFGQLRQPIIEAFEGSQGFWIKYYPLTYRMEILFKTCGKRNKMKRRPLLAIVQST